MPKPSSILATLIGQTVSHVWRGHGSAIFVEFGKLTNSALLRNSATGHPRGEACLMIEWGWRIERPRSILGGAWSSERRWPGMFKQMIGNQVAEVEVIGRLPEIVISLNNGLRVMSMMMDAGQPMWAVLTPHGNVCVKRGALCVESTETSVSAHHNN